MFAPENRNEVIPGSYQLGWQQHVFHVTGWWGWLARLKAEVVAEEQLVGLVIGSDTNSRILDPTDKATFPLFGDGAGAVVLAPGGQRQGQEPRCRGGVHLHRRRDQEGRREAGRPVPVSMYIVCCPSGFVKVQAGRK